MQLLGHAHINTSIVSIVFTSKSMNLTAFLYTISIIKLRTILLSWFQGFWAAAHALVEEQDSVLIVRSCHCCTQGIVLRAIQAG